MASIEKYEVKTGRTARERTRYRVRYRTPAGRQTDKKGFRTKDEAERFLAHLQVSIDKAEYVQPTSGRLPVGALAPVYLARKKSLLKTSAYESLESAWRVHVEPVWGTTALNKITTPSVELWIMQLMEGTTATGRGPLGASMVIRCHEVLAGLLDQAVKENRLVANPARGVELPRKTRKPHVYLSHEDAFKLAEATGREALILTLAYTGLRWGEATALEVRHVDFKRRRLSIEQNYVHLKTGGVELTTPKSGSARSVPFPEFLAEHLKTACALKLPNAPVFTEPGGGMLARPHSQTGWWVKARRELGLYAFTLHDLRHSAASFAVSAGANVKAVQRMLGHSSAAMTLDVYADLFDTDLDAVATALDVAVRGAVFSG